MSPRLVSICSAAALLTTSIVADAASITNRDEKDIKVTIVEGETSTEHTLKPTQVLDKVCMNGCIVRLEGNDDDEYEVEAGDIVAIEEGFLYYDGPDAQEKPVEGGAPQMPPTTPAPASPAPQPKQ
jgi:hypothetical protein